MNLADIKFNRIEEEAGEYTSEAIRALRDAIVERDRLLKLAEIEAGSWTDVPFYSGNFTAGGTMTWGVDSGDVSYLTYNLNRNVLNYRGSILTSDVGGVAHSQLRLALPTGLSVRGPSTTGYLRYSDAGAALAVGAAIATTGTQYVAFEKVDQSNWTTTSSDNTSITFSITCEVE